MAVIGTLVLLGIAIPTKIIGDKSEAVKVQKNPLESLSDTSSIQDKIKAIRFVAINNGVDPELMVRFSNECEDIGLKDICIVDTNQKLSCGYFMFQEDTLKYFCPDLKWGVDENMKALYLKDNILCAGRVFALGLDTIKQHWVTCSKKILGIN